MSRARRILLTAAASLLLAGCSTLENLESLFGPSDQPLTITNHGTIDEGTITFSPEQLQVGTFTTTESGTLAVTVDWGSADHAIVLELYQGTCTATDILEDRLTGTCSDATLVAVADDEPVVKPNVLTAQNLAPGTYTLVIEYFGQSGQTTETVTFSIVLSAVS